MLQGTWKTEETEGVKWTFIDDTVPVLRLLSISGNLLSR